MNKPAKIYQKKIKRSHYFIRLKALLLSPLRKKPIKN
jgi:hypothetical protein